MQSWKKITVRKGLNGMPSIFYECLCCCVCVCVRAHACAVHASKFVFVGSTLLSSSFRKECVSVCVFLHSPQGLFQLRAKNRETLKELLCTFE